MLRRRSGSLLRWVAADERKKKNPKNLLLDSEGIVLSLSVITQVCILRSFCIPALYYPSVRLNEDLMSISGILINLR